MPQIVEMASDSSPRGIRDPAVFKLGYWTKSAPVLDFHDG
jgi:hypothetical protein